MQETRVDLGSSEKRQKLLRKGVLLEIATIFWNLLEATVAIISGLLAGSVALIGFGFDSLIETTSAGIVAWRLQVEINGASIEDVESAEKLTGKIAGFLLFALALYVLIDSLRCLLGYGDHAHESWIGVVITILALVVMPILARAKLTIAQEIGSKALKADAIESSCCAWFALATLAGLVLNATLHWWWADSVAALVLVPLMVREGLEAIKNEDCSCHESCSESK